MIAYRICERKGENLLTLFHPNKGSRVLPMNKWLTADIKNVSDGSRKTSINYISGFHALEDINECREFIKKFRKQRDLVLVECEVEGIRKKYHSRSNIILADKIKLLKIIEKLIIKK